MGGADRGAAMAASVMRAGRSLGMDLEGLALLGRAHALAMEPRLAQLDDDHHPLYLHPGRTALILLRDVECRDATILSAAALLESEDDALRVAASRVEAAMGPEVHTLVGSIPLPGSPTLVEDLVTASEEVRLVALAERLDHVRHAHLRDADDAWRRQVHAQAGEVYLPIAQRTHPRLAQRYEHWHWAFARRLGRG